CFLKTHKMAEEEDKKGRAGRATSNVFAKLSKKLMQEMKEAIKSKAGGEQKRAQRAPSNVFAMFRQSQVQEFKEKQGRHPTNVLSMFRQSQVQEFKEAFTMIDQNRDGIIDIEDLKDMYSNLGRIPPDSELNEMLKDAPGPINFTTFLNLFGEKLSGTDPEDTIRQAFSMFDTEGKGFIPEEYLKDLLSNMGDNFTAEEIKQTWKEAPLEKGKFDYNTFVGILKGKEDDGAP
ncbi:myosin regulatory light chain LC-2, mantle muscle isoform X2, partial [Biomphalaria glabrata]